MVTTSPGAPRSMMVKPPPLSACLGSTELMRCLEIGMNFPTSPVSAQPLLAIGAIATHYDSRQSTIGRQELQAWQWVPPDRGNTWW
jgi:hypothetical protein|eukprot:SAG25_NODE_2920_length_1314_cov_0.750617_2_plen_86_part_00